jgi:hypothetical protein
MTYIPPHLRSEDDKLALMYGTKKKRHPKVVSEADQKTITKKRYAEQDLQTALCKYMKLQYPNVIFHVDAGSAKNRTGFMQGIHKAQQFKAGIPDFFILKPNKAFYGLFIELKADRSKIWNKNGTRLKSDHLDEQEEFHRLLNEQGYFATFACGFEEAKIIIDKYLN